MSNEQYKRFQIWIESMSDEEYEMWLEDDASDKQEERALEFRPEPDTEIEQELEDMQSPNGGQVITEQRVSRGGVAGFFRRLFGR